MNTKDYELEKLLDQLWSREISADDAAEELCYNGPRVDEVEETLRQVWRHELSADEGVDIILPIIIF